MTLSAAARRAGLALLVGALAAGPAAVLAALPPFQIGVWYQAEPVIAALHAVSAAAALGLGLALAGGVRACRRALGHPLVLVPLAIALWSAAMTPLVHLPALSWFGTAEQGEGIAWYADLAVLVAAGLVVQRWRAARRALGGLALVALLATTTIALSAGLDDRWGLFRHDDYLGFYGLFAAAALATWIAPRRRWQRAALIAAGLAVVAVSDNRSAVAAAVLAGLCVAGATLAFRGRPQRVRVASFAVALALPVAAVPAVLVIGARTPESSLWSRALHFRVAAESLAARPAALVTGFGWGRHGDRVIAYAPLSDIDLTGIGPAPTWDAMGRYFHFHASHEMTEALLSAGLPALVLVWLLPALPAWLARRRRALEAGLVAIGGAGLLAMWPLEAGAVPWLALAIAGVARPAARLRLARRWSALAAAGCVALGAGLAATAAMAVATAREASDALAANRDTAGLSEVRDAHCARLYRDFGRGGVHLSAAYRSFSVDLSNKLSGAGLTAADAARFADYACAARARLAAGSSLRLATADLLATAEVAVMARQTGASGPAVDAVLATAVDGWHERLTRFLARAPRRTDLAIPFLELRFADGAEAEVAALTAEMLARDADDPVALWYSGGVLAGDQATAAVGLARMRRALDLGLAQRMPIDPELAQKVRDAAARVH